MEQIEYLSKCLKMVKDSMKQGKKEPLAAAIDEVTVLYKRMEVALSKATDSLDAYNSSLKKFIKG